MPPSPLRPWMIRTLPFLTLFWFVWAGVEVLLGLISPAVRLSHAVFTALAMAGFGGLGLWSQRRLRAQSTGGAPSPHG